MSRTLSLLALAGFLAGCSEIPTTSDGVAFLEIQSPASTTITVGDTVRLQARTLDASGAPIEVAVVWRTPDTTVTVTPATGIVVARFPGTGRVQAVVGDDELVSDFIRFTVQAPPAAGPAR